MYKYNDLIKHAKLNDGRVITKEITFLKKCKSVKFECSVGHRWEIVAPRALTSPWCLECNGTKVQRNTIEMMQEIAIERGGKCLSKKYINSETKLKWECSEGHTWNSTPHTVKNKKSWCPTCKANKQKNTLEDMHKLAKANNGKCLSKEYVLNNVNLVWECSEGHVWENQPANITMGQWCPTCSKENEKLTIKEMKEIAKQRDGKCLSKKYKDNKTKLKWECSKGHQWMAAPNLVKHHNSWCPVCAGNMKKTIFGIMKVAKEFGGKVLSKKYINSKEKLKWRCSEGHVFYKSYSHVAHRGQWCPHCRKSKQIKNAS